ncbi:MAG TPA: uroporphyrinogen-III synthase [Aeromonadales bacterium]|nr:uroporphyrinogen-III synthase [Aeromonadales bacterium]
MRGLLATRQPEDNEVLTKALEAWGWQVVNWPALVIKTTTVEVSNESVRSVDIVIFTSKNSVSAQLLKRINIENKTVICVGPTTAEKLFNQTGIKAATPATTTTEGLLSSKLLEVSNKKILIIKGKGGRKLLEDELRKRNNEVFTLDVYSRLENTLTDREAEKINKLEPEYVLVTSVEGLCSLIKQIDEGKLTKKLLSKHLLSFSNRINEIAIKKGFEKVSTVNKMSNKGIVEALVK